MDIASFAALKLAIVKTTGLSKDALHIHIGLLVFCLGCLVLRKPLRAWTPLLWVALMVGVGEWLAAGAPGQALSAAALTRAYQWPITPPADGDGGWRFCSARAGRDALAPC